MTVGLAATYDPRGEIPRLERLFPQIQGVYSGIVISLPPWSKDEDVKRLEALPSVQVIINQEWATGRYMALKGALDGEGDSIQYVDLDRLIRWVETRPEEWLQTVDQVEETDCLVIGRTAAAWATHPQVMIQVEQVINSTFSYLLGQELDFGAGSKGLSRRAAEFVMANTRPENALGTDVEWPILLHRAGFRVQGVLVDGLDWEIPDQYQDKAADLERQMALAKEYDEKVANWRRRVGDTVNVFAAGLDALQRELIGV
jgi:hypothetical protein